MTRSLVPPGVDFRATTGIADKASVPLPAVLPGFGGAGFVPTLAQHTVSVLGALPASVWPTIVRLGDECRSVLHHASGAAPSGVTLAGSTVVVLAVREPVPVIRQLMDVSGNARILVYAQNDDAGGVLGCLRAGASGYVRHADDDGAELVFALRQLCRRMGYVSTSLLGPVVDGLRRGDERATFAHGSAEVTIADRTRDSLESLVDELTPHQRRLLVMVANGVGTSAIARRLQRSLREVRAEIAGLCRLLGADGRTGIEHSFAALGAIGPVTTSELVANAGSVDGGAL